MSADFHAVLVIPYCFDCIREKKSNERFVFEPHTQRKKRKKERKNNIRTGWRIGFFPFLFIVSVWMVQFEGPTNWINVLFYVLFENRLTQLDDWNADRAIVDKSNGKHFYRPIRLQPKCQCIWNWPKKTKKKTVAERCADFYIHQKWISQ